MQLVNVHRNDEHCDRSAGYDLKLCANKSQTIATFASVYAWLLLAGHITLAVFISSGAFIAADTIALKRAIEKQKALQFNAKNNYIPVDELPKTISIRNTLSVAQATIPGTS